MEIADYISQSRATGLADGQIASNLIASGWSKEQIQPYLVGPTKTAPEATDQNQLVSKKSVRILWVLVGLVIAATSIITYVVLNTNASITDSKYGFVFTDIHGWKKISPRNGAYISLATTNNNTVL